MAWSIGGDRQDVHDALRCDARSRSGHGSAACVHVHSGLQTTMRQQLASTGTCVGVRLAHRTALESWYSRRIAANHGRPAAPQQRRRPADIWTSPLVPHECSTVEQPTRQSESDRQITTRDCRRLGWSGRQAKQAVGRAERRIRLCSAAAGTGIVRAVQGPSIIIGAGSGLLARVGGQHAATAAAG